MRIASSLAVQGWSQCSIWSGGGEESEAEVVR